MKIRLLSLNLAFLVLMTFIFMQPLPSAWSHGAHGDCDEGSAEGTNKVSIKKSGQYGSAITIKEKQELQSLLAAYDQYKNQDVCIEGQVSKVCAEGGCWMQVKSGEQSMRVTFKDYGFTVPSALLDKKVRMQGRLSRSEVQDQGKNKAVYKFEAVGVQTL